MFNYDTYYSLLMAVFMSDAKAKSKGYDLYILKLVKTCFKVFKLLLDLFFNYFVFF